ncbi:MAG: ABC transporter substrate-binding protein [Marinobacter sp.]
MVIRGTVSALGAAIALTITSPSNADSLTPVTVGHLVALDMAPLFVGVESGCFEEQGLAVDTRFFANPGDNNAALAGGSLDFNINPFTLPFFAANSGVPIRVVSAAGGWGVMEVIAQRELGLDSMEDLKSHVASDGRKLSVAVLQGDTLELIMVTELERVGLSQDDVDFIYFDDLLAMVEAFRSGGVDILSHIKPYTSEMVENRGATMITNNASAWAEKAPNTVVSTMQSTLEENPELVRSYLKGMQCAADIINNDVEQALEVLQGGNYFRVSDDVLRQAFASAPQPISFTPDIDSVQYVVNELAKLGYISDETSAEDIFRTDMIESLEQ